MRWIFRQNSNPQVAKYEVLSPTNHSQNFRDVPLDTDSVMKMALKK